MDSNHQRRFDNQPIDRLAEPPSPLNGLLSARQAAALLGVQVRTLYAYASRGWLHSHAGAGRTRRYSREEVARWKVRRDARSGHGPVAAGALRWGEPVLESALTFIDDRGPWYRGHSAVALASSGAPFEAVAELLWTGQLPDDRPRWPQAGALPSRLRALVPPGEPPLTSLQVAVPVLGARDPARFGTSGEHDRARRLVARLAASATTAPRRKDGVARTLLAALGGVDRPAAVRAVDAALVLMADHELNASTFAARIAASAGADLYSCVGAALATLSGPLHGGACDRIEALISEAGGEPRRARQVVRDRLRRGEIVPGFNNPLYPAGDPRAPSLMEAARRLGGRRARIAFAVAEAVGEPPAVELALVALAAALDLPRGAAIVLFAVGRSAGWIAHALEQRAAGYLLRPRARYTGETVSPGKT